MSNELGQIMATRTFDRAGGGSVVLNIGKVSVDPADGGRFRCPFQFVGVGDEKVRFSYGEDELQALELAVDRAFMYLEAQEEVRKGHLTWLGGPDLRRVRGSSS